MHLHCFCEDGLVIFEVFTLMLILCLLCEHIGHRIVPAVALGLAIGLLECFLCDFVELI